MYDPLDSSNGFDYSLVIFDDSTSNAKPYYYCPACQRKLNHNQVRNHKCVNPYKLLHRVLDKLEEINNTILNPTYTGATKIFEILAQKELLEELLKDDI